jgi:hypothetical protein
MNWMLKIVASQAVKLGVSYALRIIIVTIAALRGVSNDGNINDEARGSITNVIKVLVSVRDFVSRLAEIIGAPMLPQVALDDAAMDAADKLARITDGL